MNLLEMMYESVERFSDRECLRYKRDGRWQSLKYREVWDLAERFALGLRALGMRPRDHVGLLANNRPEWPISDYAIQRLVGVVVPIYPTLPSGQVRFILENADVRFLIVENAAQLHKVRQDWPPSLERVITMDEVAEASGANVISFAEVLRLGEQALAAGAADPLPDLQQIPDTELVTIVHTSGTSGRPKGVMLSHRNLVSNVQASLKLVPVSESDVGLSYLPLSHIFERTVGQFASLSLGGTIAYAEGIDKIQQNLLEIRPTVLITVPRLLEKVYAKVQEQLQALPALPRRVLENGMRSDKSNGITYRLVDTLVFRKLRAALGGRLRLVISGGAALAAEIASFYMRAGIPVYEGYGMTESAPVISVNPLDEPRPGTVGKPLPGVEVKIAEDGELLVRGPNVMMGYYKQPEETQAALEDGWLHTGDIAEIIDGYIRIVDRKKNILVLATGKNVAPLPIESALCLRPHIGTAVVIGDKRKYVSALIVPDFEAMQPFLEKHGIGGPPEEWVRHPKVQALFQAEVQQAVADFANFEQPKRFILLPHDFTIESGDLTPTLKVRNKVIMEKYRDQIEAMYNGSDYIPVFPESGRDVTSLHADTTSLGG
jgi:long-chain acyl-CoA synthetase